MSRNKMDPRIGRKMDCIGKATDKAMVFTLTDSATFARNDLLDALRTKVDRPAPFTLNKSGYAVRDRSPFQRLEDIEKLAGAFRIAGVPE